MTEDAFKRQFVATWLACVSVQRNFVARKNWPIRRALRLADLAWRDLVKTEDEIDGSAGGQKGSGA